MVAVGTAVLLIAFFFTLNQWSSQPPTTTFNNSSFDITWEIAALALLLLSLVVLVLRRPESWGVGLGFLLVNLVGHAVQFLWPPANGDFSGVVRLAQIIYVSWFANCVVPAKLGDAYRGYLLKHNGKVSFSATFGTIFAERTRPSAPIA